MSGFRVSGFRGIGFRGLGDVRSSGLGCGDFGFRV